MNLMWTALLMGLMGGFHCIGMCGPIALALPAGQDGRRWAYVRGRIAYNLGRVTTYSLLGAVFGLFGFTLNLTGLQQGISVLSGLLILLLQFAPGNLSGKVARLLGFPTLVASIKRYFSTFFRRKGWYALYMTGLLNGLLPCGFVYLALAGSLTAGSVANAALYMALFGAGTIPLMLTLSLSAKMISLRFRNPVQKLVPYVAAAIAVLFILRGLALDIPYLSPELKKVKQTEITVCH